ncbi:MAG: hypothetical protein AB8E15_05620 [Bdellovibrionales bacterium]
MKTIGFFLIYLFTLEGLASGKSTDWVNQRVNDHLQMTNVKIHENKKDSELMRQRAIYAQPNLELKQDQDTIDIDFMIDDDSSDTYTGTSENGTDLTSDIQREIEQKQIELQHQQALQEEFKSRFIRNVKDSGKRIHVDTDLLVHQK